MSRAGRWAANLALLAGSLVVAGVLAELFFRFVVPASDYPAVDYAAEVIRYMPNQAGTYRIRDEIAAPFRINAQGWNTRHETYRRDKPDGATRVAIIGDSFVEGFQVPVDKSLAEQLEASPGKATLQVYRFAISGAPFSQYLWIAEHEVAAYRPDIVVFNLVHNDFDESLRPLPGRYTGAFMTLKAEGDRVTGEIAPQRSSPGWTDTLAQSAVLRFLRFNRQVTLGAIYNALGLTPPGEEAPPAPAPGVPGAPPLPPVDANVMIDRVLAHPRLIAAAIDHMVARAGRFGRDHGARVLLLMDGARQAIYEGRDSSALRLNAMVAESAARHGVELVDLHPVFAAAWRRDRQRFDYPHDGHWNARGHAVAAGAIRAWIDR